MPGWYRSVSREIFLRKLEELSFATKCIIAITIDAIADRQTSIYKNYCIGLDDREKLHS
jgi:hypothetical protein